MQNNHAGRSPVIAAKRQGLAKRAVLLALLCLPLSGCATTVGQQFRDIMADIDADCKKKGLGPYMNYNEPQSPDKLTDSSCDILTIKPADPLATEEGRFAYSIKLPASHDKLKAQYRFGMGAAGYFKELCEKDAGEWIFKTVEGVEGVFQGRQDSPKPQRGASSLIFQFEEAAEVGILNRNLENNLVQPYHGRYNYIERPRNSDEAGKPYVRFFRGAEVPGHPKIGTQKNGRPIYVSYIVNKEPADTLNSRYGFTWRQISTADMLENGITGGETIIYDRTTDEVLAFRRFFNRYWPRSDSRYSRLVNSDSCHHPSFPKYVDAFIQSVLIPNNQTE